MCLSVNKQGGTIDPVYHQRAPLCGVVTSCIQQEQGVTQSEQNHTPENPSCQCRQSESDLNLIGLQSERSLCVCKYVWRNQPMREQDSSVDQVVYSRVPLWVEEGLVHVVPTASQQWRRSRTLEETNKCFSLHLIIENILSHHQASLCPAPCTGHGLQCMAASLRRVLLCMEQLPWRWPSRSSEVKESFHTASRRIPA